MRTVLLAKLHGGCVTACNLHYEGSCGIGPDLLKASGIMPLERVSVLNISTGDRLETYVIAAEKNGEISLNGAAARYAAVGDKVIILAYVQLTERQIRSHRARIVILDCNNRIVSCREEAIKL
ncbi:MAG: aspartate 1-decarboxylase [Verrucomicrobiae bacterium]|nr:aspartate 1-decarboxylase [Verrucomicrobiae bacterium]